MFKKERCARCFLQQRPKPNHFSTRVGINNDETNYYWVEKDGKRTKGYNFQTRIVCSKRAV